MAFLGHCLGARSYAKSLAGIIPRTLQPATLGAGGLPSQVPPG